MATSAFDLLGIANAADTSAQELVNHADEAIQKLAGYSRQTWSVYGAVTAKDLEKIGLLADVNDIPDLKRSVVDMSAVSDFDPGAFKQATYASSFFTFLEPQLIAFIRDGGPGIAQDVQDAIFNETRERDLQALNDALDLAAVGYGKRGFPLPTSMLASQKNELIKKYQDQQATTNRQITALIAERAQDTMKAAVSSGVRMEEIQSQFSLGFARLYIDVSNQLINQFRMEQDANIAEFRGELEKINAKVEIGKANADIAIQENIQTLKQWEISLNQTTERFRLNNADADRENTRKLEALKASAVFYSDIISSLFNQVSAISSEYNDITSTETVG